MGSQLSSGNTYVVFIAPETDTDTHYLFPDTSSKEHGKEGSLGLVHDGMWQSREALPIRLFGFIKSICLA